MAYIPKETLLSRFIILWSQLNPKPYHDRNKRPLVNLFLFFLLFPFLRVVNPPGHDSLNLQEKDLSGRSLLILIGG